MTLAVGEGFAVGPDEGACLGGQEVVVVTQHVEAEGLQVDARNGGQFVGDAAVLLASGGRLQEQRVGDEGAEQELGFGWGNGESAFPTTGKENAGRGAPDPAVDIDRFARLDVADTVVVDDGEDLGFFKAPDALGALEVVDQRDLGAWRRDQLLGRYEATELPGVVDDKQAKLGVGDEAAAFG